MIHALIFDCFGVVLTDALQELRAELAVSNPSAEAEVRDIVAANNRGLMTPAESNQRIAALFGMDAHEFRAHVAAGESRNEPLLKYILELRKTYKVAMLSNIAGSSLQRRFPDDELARYFDAVVASADIGYIKPEPEAYIAAAARIGVAPEECIFVDDRELFCVAATEVGMTSIVYTDFVRFKHDVVVVLSDAEV
jgi:HAD superfamily hydrolase (TIGR01509 family)